MSSIFVIIVVLAVNLIPSSVEQFSIKMSPGKTFSFIQQEDGGWKAISLGNKKKTIGVYYIDGLKIVTKLNGHEYKINSAAFLGIKTVDQLKGLKQITNPSQQIEIEKKQSKIFIRVKAKPVKVNGKLMNIYNHPIIVSWIDK